ncbi:hypothetical protein Taro_010328 [Colocasia esculenta]|uniref:BHLH domain-containing protein n=1 Tax=Colocasia esculenta TaxID=4460 RepID=A0A843U7E8_COLES|nr:hypothetical protein [Colocasia esculenta]
MAAFSYRHHYPFAALDPSSSAYLLSPPPFDLPLPPPPQAAGDLPPDAVPSWLPCYYPVGTPAAAARTSAAVATHLAASSVPAPAAESSSSLSSGSGGRTVPSGDHRVASSSSSSAQLSEVASRASSPMGRKRKDGQKLSSGSAQPDDAKEVGSRKQKKRSGSAKEADEKKKAVREAPTGYIHVRARRGQATDSHSLAERARREKISERMKMLQGLVPGCDKVVGKALMLDEIINYVQSLQHQVEFLSMKLASVNPMLYDSSCFDLEFMHGFGPETDGVCGIKLQKLESPSPAPLPVQQASHIQPTSFVETANNCPVQDTSVSFLLHGQGPNAIPQDNSSSFVMQLGDTRHSLAGDLQVQRGGTLKKNPSFSLSSHQFRSPQASTMRIARRTRQRRDMSHATYLLTRLQS